MGNPIRRFAFLTIVDRPYPLLHQAVPEAVPRQPHPVERQRHAGIQTRLDHADLFFAAIEMTRMPMVVTDPNRPDNPVVFANPAFLQLTGYAAEEVIGRNCRFMQGPGTDPAAAQALRQAIEARTDIAIEILNYRRDGSAFWNALFISPVFDAEGRLLYHFGSQLDVTRRREAEAALRHAQRLEALGQLTGGVAHDFNNLLQVLTGSLEALRPVVAASDNPRIRRRHEGALEAARRAALLTRQLLAFSRRQRLEGKPTDLNQVLAGLGEVVGTGLGPGVTLRVDPAPCLPAARVDPAELEAALVNLLSNARDAMPRGGEVVVATRALTRAEALAGAGPDEETGEADDFVEVSVRDQGSGIPPEIIDRVTEPFFTTKAVGRGSGLGLAQVYGFARQSGGHLRIESPPGAGTVMRLRFPALADTPAEAPARPPPAEEIGGAESVLVVDDDAGVLELAAGILADLGYQVATAPDARAALALLAEPGRRVDLLFSDVVMPGGMNGISLANEARLARPALRVLLSTGYIDPREEAASAGVRPHGYPVIQKPYRRGDLARRVRRMLDERG